MDETLAPGRDDDTAEIPVVASTSAHGRHAAPPPRRSAGWWALRIAALNAVTANPDDAHDDIVTR